MESVEQVQQTRGREVAPTAVSSCCWSIAKHGVDVYSVTTQQFGDLPISTTKTTDNITGKTPEIELEKVASWNLHGIDVAEFSPLGDRLGIPSSSDSLCIIDPAKKFSEIGKIKTGPVQKLMFSPLSTYVVVMTQYSQGINEKNVKVYKLQDLSLVTSFTLKGLAAQEKWPPLTWSNKELYCFTMATNEVQVFPGNLADFPTPSSRIPGERVEAVSQSIELQGDAINVAIFTHGTKDKPSFINVYQLESPATTAILLNKKVFFNVESVTLSWNFTGTAVLAVANSDVDRSGKSYYGTSSLLFLEAKADGQALQVISCDKGPVLDCQWFPSTNEFIVINGHMPPSIKLYDGKNAEPKLSFGEVRRNTCRLNPFGRFILLAGFGNLPGDFDVWDKNKKKIIGSGKSECAVDCEWAPNGRVFICATTTPRMRVDNQIKVFRYNGDLLARLSIPDLYFAKWIPCKTGNFPDRGISRDRDVGTRCLDNEASNVYRPPKATKAFDDRIRAKVEIAHQTTAVVVKNTKTLPPGAEFAQPMSKSAKKNMARKAKKKGTSG